MTSTGSPRRASAKRDAWLLRLSVGAAVAVLTLGVVLEARGQARGGNPPKFEVVSIVPQPPGTRWHPPPLEAPGPVQPGGQYRDPQAVLYTLLQFAYPDTNIPGKTLLGVPLWGRRRIYAFQGVAPGGKTPTRDEMRLMMRAVLASRFGLKFHTEEKEMPVFVLTLAKGGTKNLKAANPASESNALSTLIGWRQFFIVAKAISIPELAGRALESWGPVVNHTGLNGYYDIDIPPVNDAPPPKGTHREDPEQVVKRSFHDEFGIDVTNGKATVPVMVIDSVHPPTPN